jgi:hypothetical protein
MDFEKVIKKLSFDVTAGATCGLLVTPIVSAVDRALAENASGKAKLWPSFFSALKEMASSPIKFLKSPACGFIWLVYGGTYVAANTTDTVCNAHGKDAAFPKWVATSVTNTTTCIAKDRAFAKLFGTKVPSNVPMGSYAAWLSRDLISMGVIFTLPPIVGKKVAEYTGSQDSGYYVAQFCLPLAMQFITTPMHLLGYDVYNNPTNNTSQRIQFLKKDYLQNVSIRMVRMCPPWSVGTIGNRELRKKLNADFGDRS